MARPVPSGGRRRGADAFDDAQQIFRAPILRDERRSTGAGRHLCELRVVGGSNEHDFRLRARGAVIRWQASMPLSPGIAKSSTTTSGWRDCAAFTTAVPRSGTRSRSARFREAADPSGRHRRNGRQMTANEPRAMVAAAAPTVRHHCAASLCDITCAPSRCAAPRGLRGECAGAISGSSFGGT